MPDLPWHSSLHEAINSLDGPGSTIRKERDMGGGCISSTSVLTLSSGRQIFMKRNGASAEDMFRQEAAGLQALRLAVKGPRIPLVLSGGTDQFSSFLLMEYLSEANRLKDFWEDFGSSLAALHQSMRSDFCGFSSDNYIGATPQSNSSLPSWIDFFRIRRLEYQLKLARDNGRADQVMTALVTKIMDRLDQFLIPCDEGGASLLHGDLWSGNFICGPDGKACIIDPAVYYGHREADLAMTELFGGYSPAFYMAYRNEWPLEPGYSERRELYNLYHMLNHLNLFGGSYAGSVLSIARRYAS